MELIQILKKANITLNVSPEYKDEVNDKNIRRFIQEVKKMSKKNVVVLTGFIKK